MGVYIKRRKIDRYSGNEINLCTKNLNYLKYLFNVQIKVVILCLLCTFYQPCKNVYG